MDRDPRQTNANGLPWSSTPVRTAAGLVRQAIRRSGRLGDRVELGLTAALSRTVTGSSHLGMAELGVLQAKYPFRRAYRYDLSSLRQRAEARAAELLSLPGASSAREYVELGCMDGMVSAQLRARGKRAAGIDLSDQFHEDSRRAGAAFARMDAQTLGLVDAAFDCAFSYNAFEHFPDPTQVLSELVRVVRPGGYIFVRFGPLYFSPWGAHAYRSITVPYCHLLFSRETMNAYAAEHGLRPLREQHVNGWSVEQFRALWRAFSGELERLQYEEREDASHLSLIRRYPGCFRGRAPSFRNFVVSHVRALFRRR